MGQLLIHHETHQPYILTCGDVLYVDNASCCLQLGDKTSAIFLARDTKTQKLDENCWTIAVSPPRLYKLIAETLAKSLAWIVASEGGSGKKMYFVLGIGEHCSIESAPALLRYERDVRKLILVYARGDMTADGNARVIELPGELRPFDFDVVDLIAASHGLPCSEYSHRDRAFIWSRADKR